MNFERQKPIPLVYKETKLDCGYRLDLLVEGRIVVELKAVDGLGPIHEAIILTYLKLSGHKIGLLINFNVALLKDGIKDLKCLNDFHHRGHRGHREEWWRRRFGC